MKVPNESEDPVKLSGVLTVHTKQIAAVEPHDLRVIC